MMSAMCECCDINRSLKNTVLLIFVFCFISQGHVAGNEEPRQYRILGLFPHPGRSHFDVFEPLLKALVGRGHNLTVISHFPQKETLDRYRDISLKDPNVPVLVNFLDMDLFRGLRIEKYLQMLMLTYFAEMSCESGLSSNVVQSFMRENNTYDLIIAEMFNSDCFIGFAHKFQGTPLIGISSCTLMNWVNDRFGNPNNPSYIPVNFMDYSDKLSFFDRVENTLMNVWTNVGYKMLSNIPANRIAKNYFGEDLPPVETIVKNASLILVNTHFTLNRPRPLQPGIIEVGGIHVGPAKKLPEVN